MPYFRKKPIIIEARQLVPGPVNKYEQWLGDSFAGFTIDGLYIKTLEGTMKASMYDWIIKGVQGEFYPCKPEIFKETYEEVDFGGVTQSG